MYIRGLNSTVWMTLQNTKYTRLRINYSEKDGVPAVTQNAAFKMTVHLCDIYRKKDVLWTCVDRETLCLQQNILKKSNTPCRYLVEDIKGDYNLIIRIILQNMSFYDHWFRNRDFEI